MKSFEKGKVSIITPCYNGERFLDRYFDSICNQTYDKVEIIIVNDGSCDNSEKICFNWKSKVEERGYDFLYILKKTCQGAASAINAGLPNVSGEFLIWPDCDDTLMPTSIERRVEFLNLYPGYALVRSDYVSVNDNNPEIVQGYGSDWADVINENIFDNLIFEKTFVTSGCYMVRSSVLFDRIPSGGIYWENSGGQNWQLLLPCTYKNKTGYIDEPLYKYFIHPESHSQKVDGDEYLSQKIRIFKYHKILIHIINDFDLLSNDEKTNYLTRIDLKYIKRRLNLALSYNKSDDAKNEMQKLREMKIYLGIRREILCKLCYFGASGFILRGYSLISQLFRKIP